MYHVIVTWERSVTNRIKARIPERLKTLVLYPLGQIQHQNYWNSEKYLKFIFITPDPLAPVAPLFTRLANCAVEKITKCCDQTGLLNQWNVRLICPKTIKLFRHIQVIQAQYTKRSRWVWGARRSTRCRLEKSKSYACCQSSRMKKSHLLTLWRLS